MRYRIEARRATTAVGAVVVVALAVGLSGCTPDDAEEAPSATVSGEASASASASPVDPAEAAKEERIAAAQQRYSEYFDIMARFSKKSQNPFPELLNGGYLASSEFQERHQLYWQRMTEDKIKQVGDGEIVSFTEVEYEGDPLDEDITGHRIRLKVCVDNSNLDLIDTDGESIITGEIPEKGLAEVLMQGQPSGLWSVRKDGATSAAC